jgi:hypothetical protein
MALNTLFKDIIWNLDTICSIDNHQTLLVFGDKLNFDDRLFQSIRRAMTDDGRSQIVSAIDKTLTLTNELLTSYKHSNYIQPSIKYTYQEQMDIAENINNNVTEIENKKDNVVTGLQVLSTFERYTSDAAFQIKIKSFIQNINKIYEKCTNLRQIYKLIIEKRQTQNMLLTETQKFPTITSLMSTDCIETSTVKNSSTSSPVIRTHPINIPSSNRKSLSSSVAHSNDNFKQNNFEYIGGL